jgi:hypothetical protein
MFKVLDKDSGMCIDLREILDLKEADFEHNSNLQHIL